MARTKRRLYVVAYDIRDNKRVKKALNIVRDFASGGQYSCYECYLNTQEIQELIARMQDIMQEEDGLCLVPIYKLDDVMTLGTAIQPRDEELFIIN